MTDENGSGQESGNPGQTGQQQQGATGGDQPWFAKFENADLRGYAELKQWKDESAVVESYRNLEKHMGAPAERLLKLPEKPDDPGWKAIHDKLGFGVPDSVDGYNLEVPEGAGPEFATKAKEWALKNGIPPRMMEGLSKDWNQFMIDASKAEVEAIKAQETADLTSLRQTWGQQYDSSVELARREAAEQAKISGLDADGLNKIEAAVGTAAFLKLFASIGSKTQGEAHVHGDSGTGTFRMSPEAAQAKINQLKGDATFFARFQKGEAQALQEWQTLNRIAAGAP